MATTPHVDPPKNHAHDDKAKAPSHTPEAKAPEAKAPAAKTPPKPHQHAVLESDNAAALFRNGHRIAKDGDPPEKWVSMGRLGDGTPVCQTPMTPEIEAEIRGGSYYLAEGAGATEGGAAPAGPPTNVDIPYVSAMGALASCTMGNWQNEPTSYAYAWQRNGVPISGATSAADYTMVAADKDKAIGCIVTATNSAGSATAPLSNTVIGP